MRFRSRTFMLLLLLAAVLLPSRPASAYSVLSHEEVVDMAWKTKLVPMLQARFPGISDDQIRAAHAYAYGGSVIQDIGYYPFGSHYFSDLLHYVRPNKFVEALLRDSTTPNEYAFALGALAHYCGDIIGHPYINQVTALENRKLHDRYGSVVTYAEDPLAHVRTEFGFDVVMVAHGAYSQENYRDFIGFQVARPLLERAFLETYGVPIGDIIKHEELAINSYRKAVSTLIPQMTKLAFVNYKDQIEQAAPGTARDKFVYRLNQTEYRREFGKEYVHVGVGGHVTAFALRFVPKIGPFKALKVSIPNAQEQDVYLKSVNATVDRYTLYLAEIHAAPAPLPAPDQKDAEQARKASNKLERDVKKADSRAEKAKNPDDKTMKTEAAVDVAKTAAVAAASAARTEAKVKESQATATGGVPSPAAAVGTVPAGTLVQPPSVPTLPELDLDTGKPAAAGEYELADQTYARLLHELVSESTTAEKRARAGSAPASGNRVDREAPQPTSTASTAPPIEPALATDLEHFFAHPAATQGPALHGNPKKQAAFERQVKTDLAALKTLEARPAIVVALSAGTL